MPSYCNSFAKVNTVLWMSDLFFTRLCCCRYPEKGVVEQTNSNESKLLGQVVLKSDYYPLFFILQNRAVPLRQGSGRESPKEWARAGARAFVNLRQHFMRECFVCNNSSRSASQEADDCSQIVPTIAFFCGSVAAYRTLQRRRAGGIQPMACMYVCWLLLYCREKREKSERNSCI